ncbi:hypothetical protein E2C01_036103 [Portunus trituberculatus]|uniref:Uncharacterized protein n=1 Tax=Portunus trituberculatus TaxID=210409 RepID=A0A5B7F5Y3_PORTR|nr:hypothetical protein [Portunus trituberculatus]
MKVEGGLYKDKRGVRLDISGHVRCAMSFTTRHIWEGVGAAAASTVLATPRAGFAAGLPFACECRAALSQFKPLPAAAAAAWACSNLLALLPRRSFVNLEPRSLLGSPLSSVYTFLYSQTQPGPSC